MKVLSNFLLPIPLNEKKSGNKSAFSKKISSKAAFLIFPLYNSSEDTPLLLLLHPLIVSSNLRLLVAKSGNGIFGKDNAEKSRGYDLESIGAAADRGIRTDNLGTKTNADAGVDDPSTAADNPSIVVDDLETATNDPNTTIDNLNITVNNLDTATNNLGIGIDADARVNNLGIATSNKTHTASFFALSHTLFLLAFSSKLVTTSLPSSLPFLSLSILRSKSILLYSVTLVKREPSSSRFPVDKI